MAASVLEFSICPHPSIDRCLLLSEIGGAPYASAVPCDDPTNPTAVVASLERANFGVRYGAGGQIIATCDGPAR
ncbi:MAG: hypothetical protein H6523_12980 [Mycolicibacterium sp.]|nr:hypothetical protein [Mycolicibacterium sp.]